MSQMWCFQRYFSTTQVPVLVVANKSDKGVVRQDYILQPEAFCAKHKLPPPQKASSRAPPTKDIFIKLATMAAFPWVSYNLLCDWITVQLSIIANDWSCYSKFQAAWMLFYRGRWLLFNSPIFYRNLKRLVHDMILKRPPGEWLGLLRLYWNWV